MRHFRQTFSSTNSNLWRKFLGGCLAGGCCFASSSSIAFCDATASTTNNKKKISTTDFYQEYLGHPVEQLELLQEHLRKSTSTTGADKERSLVFFLGDSVLDNKAYIKEDETVPAFAGYENILNPPTMRLDVATQLNRELQKDGSKTKQLVAVNAAREETSIGEHRRGKALNEHDKIVKENLRRDDILVVSMGGNDVALKPHPLTMAAVAWLVTFANENNINNGTAYGMKYLTTLLHADFQDVLNSVCEKTAPRLIVPLFIYYPCTVAGISTKSWADKPLKTLGYDTKFGKRRLQVLIDALYARSWNIVAPQCQLQVRDASEEKRSSKIVPVALAEVMDADDPSLYVERVEPSAAGGARIAKAIAKVIAEHY